MNKEQITAELIQFTGTEHYYRHPFGFNYTDGVRFVAKECKAYWLIDEIASWRLVEKIKREEFLVYKLKVNEDRTADLSIEDGNDNIIARQKIEFTDFPLEEITMWFTNGVLYLPSEH